MTEVVLREGAPSLVTRVAEHLTVEAFHDGSVILRVGSGAAALPYDSVRALRQRLLIKRLTDTRTYGERGQVVTKDARNLTRRLTVILPLAHARVALTTREADQLVAVLEGVAPLKRAPAIESPREVELASGGVETDPRVVDESLKLVNKRDAKLARDYAQAHDAGRQRALLGRDEEQHTKAVLDRTTDAVDKLVTDFKRGEEVKVQDRTAGGGHVKFGGTELGGRKLKRGDVLASRTSDRRVEFVGFTQSGRAKVKPAGGGKTREISKNTLGSGYVRA